jgi:antitoxin (DNA-binding transcriptional repressor) of toxin-antitoxin stability system
LIRSNATTRASGATVIILGITDIRQSIRQFTNNLRAEREMTLTYRGKPVAQAVPFEQLKQERDELQRLRELLAAHGIAA